MTPHAFALAHALTLEENAAPLSVRAGWASFLRRVEPGPGLVQGAVLEAHRQGHMRAGKLTLDGVRLALEAMSGPAIPPPFYSRPLCWARW
ncbi:hypothetical protein [Deinococcus frigens]|uniref:hypothetical protein n=1 Tax=Deinococcus frigens TaxID=249403 RepID=UPI0004970331|nr:hypothetical protein [Deinococcus frigens]